MSTTLLHLKHLIYAHINIHIYVCTDKVPIEYFWVQYIELCYTMQWLHLHEVDLSEVYSLYFGLYGGGIGLINHFILRQAIIIMSMLRNVLYTPNWHDRVLSFYCFLFIRTWSVSGYDHCNLFAHKVSLILLRITYSHLTKCMSLQKQTTINFYTNTWMHLCHMQLTTLCSDIKLLSVCICKLVWLWLELLAPGQDCH